MRFHYKKSMKDLEVEMNSDVLDEIERVARKKYRGFQTHHHDRPKDSGGAFWVILEVCIKPEEVENIYKDEKGCWRMRKA